ncbi:MAG: anaerobic ribonucleoside-triphosphate reductase activating protein [Actinobacteria bacterium]|nr:anaerobic ribonucleoside-triphosphate reductase activating protein [Actinomycetota bacterium]MCG2818019.1 anaerobic ribonucleoside-triphosphate reductase activating protein [Actinomycetes bacterium]MBU4179481.1 anaerobic ribonucleoside-triphosphate reductase activating protein [Actinomycetota bacterium]MBU4218464.1 anaerobic ribonucleoside-triphosphate reductase activating protein [Actinomycetota bacterium]MBU4358225.1 anaerobic ribonucleoside-triphosphate reductase activating protein [Actin
MSADRQVSGLEVKGFIPNTMLDWEGMLASTVFLPRCNFRCPYCQNPDLVLHPERLETVPFSVIREYMRERAGWIEGVCITGGEPCLHKGLPDFCSALKAEGVGVKLDTNGSLPEMLAGLISDGLVDYVAMDVKAPLEPSAYRLVSGNGQHNLLDRVRESIEIIRESGTPHEFRTTVVPMMHGPGEIERIAEYLRGEERYILQYFSPRETIDPRFSKLKPFTEEDMLIMLEKARVFIPGAITRGAPAGMDQ